MDTGLPVPGSVIADVSAHRCAPRSGERLLDPIRDMPTDIRVDPRTGVDARRVALPKLLTAAALLTAVLPLSACAATPVPQARVVVRIAPSTHPQGYEVHLAQQKAGFRSRFTLRSGQTRTVSVPQGWVTVRVAGVCVVPTATAGTTTVEVRPDDCRIA
jgi:hypothetical protein